jgi:hypothetical protein
VEVMQGNQYFWLVDMFLRASFEMLDGCSMCSTIITTASSDLPAHCSKKQQQLFQSSLNLTVSHATLCQ